MRIVSFGALVIVILQLDYCHSNMEEQLVDGFTAVELPDMWKFVKSDSAKSDEIGTKPSPQVSDVSRSRRLKRSSWSLPTNTSVRMIADYIMPVAPLNNTFSSFTLDLIYRFVLPNYNQLVTLYSSLGRLDEDVDKDDDLNRNLIDLEFFEEQRANEDRRNVYRHVEELFEKFGYDGKTCLLRAMCELAEAPLLHHGLMGKLIDLIFSPSIVKIPDTMQNYLNSNRIRRHATAIPEIELLQQPVKDDYTTAHLDGKDGKCWARYSSCPVSILKLFNP